MSDHRQTTGDGAAHAAPCIEWDAAHDAGTRPVSVGARSRLDGAIHAAVEATVGARDFAPRVLGKGARTRHTRFALLNA